MYSFYIDFNEGAIRLTVKARPGWFARWLLGPGERTVIEAYLDRRDCIALGSKLLRQAQGLGRVRP
jgi:hypothetical protein